MFPLLPNLQHVKVVSFTRFMEHKHEHKAWSMKCNHLWQMYSGGKTNIKQKCFNVQFSFLGKRSRSHQTLTLKSVALQLQNCSDEQDIQMWHITFPSVYDAHGYVQIWAAGQAAVNGQEIAPGWRNIFTQMMTHNQCSLAGRGQCFHCAKNDPQLLSVFGFIMTLPANMNRLTKQ